MFFSTYPVQSAGVWSSRLLPQVCNTRMRLHSFPACLYGPDWGPLCQRKFTCSLPSFWPRNQPQNRFLKEQNLQSDRAKMKKNMKNERAEIRGQRAEIRGERAEISGTHISSICRTSKNSKPKEQKLPESQQLRNSGCVWTWPRNVLWVPRNVASRSHM